MTLAAMLAGALGKLVAVVVVGVALLVAVVVIGAASLAEVDDDAPDLDDGYDLDADGGWVPIYAGAR